MYIRSRKQQTLMSGSDGQSRPRLREGPLMCRFVSLPAVGFLSLPAFGLLPSRGAAATASWKASPLGDLKGRRPPRLTVCLRRPRPRHAPCHRSSAIGEVSEEQRASFPVGVHRSRALSAGTMPGQLSLLGWAFAVVELVNRRFFFD
jgi:hypothetical protein